MKKPLEGTQQREEKEMMFQDDYIESTAPTDTIYTYRGKYYGDENRDPQAISNDNTAWANTVVASEGYMLGMVVFTGKETRMEMNNKTPR